MNLRPNQAGKSKYEAKYIKPRVLLLMAFRNMTFKKLRTGLTIGGVVIGIGSIVFLVSLGLGLQHLVTKEVVGSKSVKAIDVINPKPKSLHINSEMIAKFKQYGEVTDIGKTYSFAGKASYQNSTTDAVIYGSDQSYLDLSSLNLVSGKKLELKNDSDVMVNSSLLRTMGIKEANKIVGQKIKLIIPAEKGVTVAPSPPNDVKNTTVSTGSKGFSREFNVVGVLETGSGAEVFAKDSVFQTAGYADYSQLKVVVRNNLDVSKVRRNIESYGFSTTSPIDTLEQINQVFTILNVILAGFGGIGMTIAILGMFNTLTISLLERTHEIGLMVTLGARKRDIRRLFVIEALFLSFLGAVIGIMAAWGLGGVINVFLVNYARSRGVNQSLSVFFIPLWLVAGILIFTVVVGIIVVAYPARRAGRINPIDALRHE